jgi:hypothetical protein
VSTPVMAPPQIARVPEASLSLPVARRRTGLIATVLVIDLALAGAGAVLLVKGLEAPPAAPAPPQAPPPPAPPPKTAAIVTPIGSGSASDTAIGSALAQIADVPPLDAAPTADAALPTHVAAKKAPIPQDPYDTDRVLVNEVELFANRSQTAFQRCLELAMHESPVHGSIHISFQVRTDGSVDHVKLSENSTGATGLASCLMAEIGDWRFVNHPAHPTTFVRPFAYP